MIKPFASATPAALKMLAELEAKKEAASAAHPYAPTPDRKLEKKDPAAYKAMDEAYDKAFDARREALDAAENEINAFLATLPAIGRLALVKRFDRWAPRVLVQHDRIREIQVERAEDAKRRPQAQYVAIGEIPTAEAYAKLRDLTYTMTAEDAASQAHSTFEELGDELRQWYDSMPENFQNGDKGTAVEEAAQACEDIAGSDLQTEECIKNLPVCHLPGETSSRSDRCGEACSLLDDLAGACSDAIDLLNKEGSEMPAWATEDDGDASYDEMTDEQKAAHRSKVIEALETLRDQAEEDKGNAEGIEFPGMY